MNAIELTPTDVALAALLILFAGGASTLFGLGLGKRLLVATVRSTIQLGLLGLVLGWTLSLDKPPLILLIMVGMATLAGIEAARRGKHRAPGLFRLSVGVMLVSSFTVTLFGTRAVLAVEPWYDPRYLIPVLGMVLGNSLNGIALGLDATLDGFRRNRAQVETLLAHGATRAQAAQPVAREAARVGLVPILNSMAAVGLISIPGMMTGQVLAGAPPAQAALYQLFILFCIAGAVALGTVAAVLGGVRLVFDERDRLRLDRLQEGQRE